ncbi:CheR family methyltransferase [Actinoplanes sp. NPDC051411]|uniref:CheR family methyltransferase n=1 Tax=Actinoplanes sp. NPDC051411 TaxID=3155522 RepID=UPI003444243D
MSGGLLEFRELLSRWLGWTFDDKDVAQLDTVLGERAAITGLSREDYLARLDGGRWDSEIVELAERLSITETYFFRHGEQFRALREAVLPARIAAREAHKVLRFLSVACSSGEEAYSLAIVGREARPAPEWVVSVTGVDANPAMLRKAGGARYSSWSLRETPPEVRGRWFHCDDRGFQVNDEIRALVRFARHNVADDDGDLWAAGQYDVIFCRNLLMYLTRPVATELIRRMTGALAPGGYLFLGHTDSLGSRPEGLEAQHDHQTFYYRRPTVAVAPPPLPRSAPPPEPHRPAPPMTEEDAYDGAIGLLRADRFADALELVTSRQPGKPRPRDTLLHGVLLVQTGRLGDAATVARGLVEVDGLNADAHQLLALCLEGGHAVDDAIAQYRLAAFLDPAFALARLRLGQLARRRGEDRPAAADLERALGLLPLERAERITLFGGGFGRMALTSLCRSELDACGAHR